MQIAGVLDSFYWAELLIRTPAGLLCQRYGGKRVLGFALLIGSLCTVLVPLTSRVHFTLVIVLRFVTGCAVVSRRFLGHGADRKQLRVGTLTYY